MQEKRKYSRVIVDMPATVRLPQHPEMSARMIELSQGGVRAKFLSALAPEINSELEFCFSLPPHKIGHKFRSMAKVRHIYDVIAVSGMGSDYRYVVGVEFQNLKPYDFETLKELLQGIQA